MEKNGSVIVLVFLFMIVVGQSNAFGSRKLSAKPDQDSPSSSSPPDDKKPISNDTPNTSPSNVESKGLNDATTNKSDLKLDQGKNQDGKESKIVASQSCKGLPICNDHEKSMTACIQDFVNGSNNLSLVVLNDKDIELIVNVTFGTSVNNNFPPFKIPAHGTKEVNITFSGDKSNKVILNAGNGDCELQVSQPKTTPVNSPPKSKDPKSPAKPKDANNHVESPTKPKEENTPSKPKDIDTPAKPKDIDTPSKPNDPPKSKAVDDPSKSKDVVNDPSKSNEIDDPSKSTSKEVNDPSKSKDTSVDTPISQNNFLDQLSFYSKQVTPIYGAYLAFVVALIIGGSWALCTFRKRRAGNGVPYQELEMGPTEPSNTVDVETAEGWDHDWDDDDWDDEGKSIRSPGGSSKSISSNGLTSRAAKKDGWDADWDD